MSLLNQTESLDGLANATTALVSVGAESIGALMTNNTAPFNATPSVIATAMDQIAETIISNLTKGILKEINSSISSTLRSTVGQQNQTDSLLLSVPSPLWIVFSVLGRIISDLLICSLLIAAILIVFPSMLKPLQYAFQSVLITMKMNMQLISNIFVNLEEEYQRRDSESRNNTASTIDTTLPPVNMEPRQKTTRPKKKVHFEISTQISERDFTTFEMRGCVRGPFGQGRSKRRDFDTSDSINQTDDDHYAPPEPYEFVNSINKSTAPRVLEKFKTEALKARETKKQRKIQDKKKYHKVDSDSLRKLVTPDINTPIESDKIEADTEIPYLEKQTSDEKWKRVSISYPNLTNAEDFNDTNTDSINYSSDEDVEVLSTPSELTISDVDYSTPTDDSDKTKVQKPNDTLKVDEGKTRRVSSGEFRQLTIESQLIDQPVHVHKNLKQLFDNIVDRDEEFRQAYNPSQFHVTSKTQTVYFRYNILTQVPIQSLVDGANITLLDLSNNYISSIPAWFSTTLKSLAYLFLPYNYLYELPENFCEMKRLKELDLSHNSFEYFPGCILKLHNIVTLDLSHNSLLLVPNDLSLLKNTITDLNISYNELREIPDDIRQLKRLKYFKFNENDLFYYTKTLILSKLNIEEDLRIKARNRRKSVKVTNYLFGTATEAIGEEDSAESRLVDGEFQSHIPQRQVLLLQFLNSESEYISHMNVLQELLYNPMMDIYKNKSEFSISSSEKDSILPPIIIDIIQHARDLFIDLKSKILPLTLSRSAKGEDDIEISKVFESRLNDIRDVYVKYPAIYENAAAVLNKLRKTNQEFDKYLKGRKKLPICNGHFYDSFLLLPVTRLYIHLKYLQKILRYTPETHPDHKNMRIIVREIRQILQEQDEFVFKINNKYKVLEIERKLKMNEPLLKPGRFFVKEGKLVLGQNKGINNFKKDVMNKLYNKGTISEIKGQVTPYWDAVKSKKIEELLELRFTELYVQVYLLSDIVIIKETNFVQKLVSRFNIYPLKGGSVKLGSSTSNAEEELEPLHSPKDKDTSPNETAQQPFSPELGSDQLKEDDKEEKQFNVTINTRTKQMNLCFICETKEDCLEWFREFDRVIKDLEKSGSGDNSLLDDKILQTYEVVEADDLSRSFVMPQN